jgi:hypothetical protein
LIPTSFNHQKRRNNYHVQSIKHFTYMPKEQEVLGCKTFSAICFISF